MVKLSLNKPLFNISNHFSCKSFRVSYTPASFFANYRSPSLTLLLKWSYEQLSVFMSLTLSTFSTLYYFAKTFAYSPENAFEHRYRYYRLGSVIGIVRGRADRPGMPGGWPGPRETGPGVARYRETRRETGAGERQWVTGPTPVTSDQGSNINISGQWGGTYTTVTPTVTYSQQWPHVPIRVLNLENVVCW